MFHIKVQASCINVKHEALFGQIKKNYFSLRGKIEKSIMILIFF